MPHEMWWKSTIYRAPLWSRPLKTVDKPTMEFLNLRHTLLNRLPVLIRHPKIHNVESLPESCAPTKRGFMPRLREEGAREEGARGRKARPGRGDEGQCDKRGGDATKLEAKVIRKGRERQRRRQSAIMKEVNPHEHEPRGSFNEPVEELRERIERLTLQG